MADKPKTTKCRCGVEIFFIKLVSGRHMPCLPDLQTIVTVDGQLQKGYLPHFIDCPYAGDFRKKGNKKL
jgi:hypothetical protein